MHVCLYSSAGVGSVAVALVLLVNVELPADLRAFILCPGTFIVAWAAISKAT